MTFNIDQEESIWLEKQAGTWEPFTPVETEVAVADEEIVDE